MAVALSASAQGKPELPYKYEFGVSLSGSPTLALDFYNKGRFTIGVYPESHANDYLDYIYGTHRGPIHGIGTVSFEGSYYLTPWLVSTLNLGFGEYWNAVLDNRDERKVGEEFGTTLTLLPELKLILNRRHAVRFFSSVACGTSLYMGSGFAKMSKYDKHPSSIHQRLDLEWVPLGIMVGRKCYFYANIGIGSVYIGGRTGLAYRF